MLEDLPEILAPTATPLDVAQLAACCGLAESALRELVEYGLLQPEDPAAPAWTFGTAQVTLLYRAGRLCRDFDLDTPALGLALELLRRIDQLEGRLHRLGLPAD